MQNGLGNDTDEAVEDACKKRQNHDDPKAFCEAGDEHANNHQVGGNLVKEESPVRSHPPNRKDQHPQYGAEHQRSHGITIPFHPEPLGILKQGLEQRDTHGHKKVNEHSGHKKYFNALDTP